MAKLHATLLEPTVKVILVNGTIIPTDNIAWAGPESTYPSGPGSTPTSVLRVRLKSGGHIDLTDVTSDGFASLLAGAAF